MVKKSRTSSKKNRKSIKKAGIILFVIGLFASIGGLYFYKSIFLPNVSIDSEHPLSIQIPTGSNFEEVKRLLFDSGFIIDTTSFILVAKQMDYQNRIHPGNYILKNNMSNKDLIRKLRSGSQDPVQVTFTSLRSVKRMAGVVSRQIEADSISIINFLMDEHYLNQMGFTKKTIASMFIPNTYEFYWNSDAREFIERMKKEHTLFWNKKRTASANEKGLSILEVSTLASIINEETNKTSEMKTIAGVYLNRIHAGMPLQADPTIKFANNDFSITRVLKKHLLIVSPYNTYSNTGLPPGPIVIPSIAAIESVLNAEHHDYYYFCAKNDFSGYHAFAKTLAQHLDNARSYQKALNRRKILN